MSKQGWTRGISAGLLAATLGIGFVPLPSRADRPPSRIANIWDWHAHQPSRGGTVAKERAAGVALPPQQQQQRNSEVERLDRELLSRESGAPGNSTH